MVIRDPIDFERLLSPSPEVDHRTLATRCEAEAERVTIGIAERERRAVVVVAKIRVMSCFGLWSSSSSINARSVSQTSTHHASSGAVSPAPNQSPV